MLKQVQIKNYLSFTEETVDLGPLTVLVGANGSGKSNFIDILRFVRDALTQGLDPAVSRRGGIENLLHRSAEGNRSSVLEINFQAEIDNFFSANYLLELNRGTVGDYRIIEETCRANKLPDSEFWEDEELFYRTNDGVMIEAPFQGDFPLSSKTLALSIVGNEPFFVGVREFFTGINSYMIVPRLLKEPEKPSNPYPLSENADNLASFLRKLKQEYQETASLLEQALQRVLGDISGYQVDQVGGYLVTRLNHIEKDSTLPFELFQESDGTLRILGLLAALYQEPPRPLIILEEPELNIHPGAMAALWEEIQKASERSQIIVTTHSPDLLDLCTAEQLRIVEKIDGVTHIGPIEAAQKEIIRKRLFAPGQLLRAQGLYREPEAGEETSEEPDAGE